MDLAYRCILPAPLGYAMRKMDLPPCAVETPEDVATIMDIRLATKEAEERKALWRSQKPACAVVTALALGLRRLRAEVRRRVDAWKTLPASAASILPATDAITVTPSPHQSQRGELHIPFPPYAPCKACLKRSKHCVCSMLSRFPQHAAVCIGHGCRQRILP